MNVIITGASRGIGRSIALKFSESGHRVIVCSRNREKLQELQNLRPDILTFACDMSEKAEVLRFAEFCLSSFPHIDVLVNNAGIFISGNILDEAEGVLEDQIHTNLYSAYYLSRQLVPRMMEQRSGHIFNMCSVASLAAYPNGGSYTISKFALLGLSKTLREELKPYNVKVTSVMPGATLTDSWGNTDLPESRFIPSEDLATLIYTITQLSASTDVEEILVRPQPGDI